MVDGNRNCYENKVNKKSITRDSNYKDIEKMII